MRANINVIYEVDIVLGKSSLVSDSIKPRKSFLKSQIATPHNITHHSNAKDITGHFRPSMGSWTIQAVE